MVPMIWTITDPVGGVKIAIFQDKSLNFFIKCPTVAASKVEVPVLVLDGKAVSQAVREALLPRVEKIKQKLGRAPHLTVVIVGEDPASQVYVKNKHLACEKLGIHSTVHRLPDQTTQAELLNTVKKLNEDQGVDAVLVQLPLPKHLSNDEVLENLSADKDADGLTYTSLGYFFAGRARVRSCTPAGVMKILEHYKISVAGKRAVVVGRSNIVGKPMAMMLTEADATVTLCHSRTPNLREYTSQADIVVVAAGKAHLLGKDDFKKGAVVIDVGIHGSGSGQGLRGDVRFEELKDWASAATPVPGGVGPMTITMLLDNTCRLAEQKAGL